jgi:hypothetical protein
MVSRTGDDDGDAVESAAVLSLAVDEGSVSDVGSGEGRGDEDGVVGVAAWSDVLSEGADDEGSVVEGGVDALAVSSGEGTSDLKACSRSGGNDLPLLEALRRMPSAARADRENLGGALGSKMSASRVSDDEHSPSTLRHSEEASVKHPVSHAIPEFNHRTEEDCHVSPPMTGEEARYVLEDDVSRSVDGHKVEEGEGESGSGGEVIVGEPSALAGDAEVLAGEPSGPEGGTGPVITAGAHVPLSVPTFSGGDRVGCGAWSRLVFGSNTQPLGERGDVSEVGDIGPSLGEDGAGVGVDLREADRPPSSSLESHIDSCDPGEERRVRELMHWILCR